ncbi:acyl-CoA desaturase [Myxococcus sp. MISCRS1]|uniref:acyl-CoA desaturase n=1 Tax=Myxococcus TaxID=32 RepID=UPI001CBCD9E2|nr:MULTISPECIES: acyl-CoA desaturase [unclassified Myxococcus]MBZ4397247.1 acyl-CoA desaturase [Myxococcus sp. AS-1-15]MCY0995539.1 acyl-CoA desaturase [Myxococcus sp. MISCRS1]
MSNALDVDGLEGDAREGKARRLAIESPFLRRMQRRHFFLFNVGPLLGTLAAVGWAFVRPIGALELGLFGVMWLITGLGVSAGYHRFFTHRSFKAPTPVRVALAIMGSMAALGPVISWAAMHRRHHRLADRPGDMHSPNLHGADFGGRVRGLVHAHFTWMLQHEYPNIVHYVPDLLEDRAIVRASRHYQTWVVLGLVVPTAIGALVTRTWEGALAGFLWGGVVRMFVVAQSISALNSILHTLGSRPFQLKDNSRNNPLLGMLIWGEGWHHNHHAFPRSASFALAWYRVDLSYWFIRLLERLGLATHVIVPTPEQKEARRARAAIKDSNAHLQRNEATHGSQGS